MRASAAALAAMLCTLLPWAPAAAQRTDAPVATTRRLKSSSSPEAVERTAQYYLKLYGKYLKTVDPLARVMVVISLARLDDPRSTEMIFTLMKTDRTPAVRVYAWEALHARLDRLSPEQLAGWIRTAVELDRRNRLRGDLRLGLVDILRIDGPTAANKAVFRKLFGVLNSKNSGDARTLQAMGKLLAEWKSPDLIRFLLEQFRDINACWRADFVLQQITPRPERMVSVWREGSKVAWRKAAAAWKKWFDGAGLTEVKGGSPPKAAFALLPAGEKITDAADPKWRKDLELEKFRLGQLDVGFVIDATGSMGPCVRWIQSDILRIMRAFELISREPRIGVTLYRDKGDEYVVKSLPLSDKARKIAAALKTATAKGGGDIPEAVYAGLKKTAGYKWSGARAKKVIVLLGDAPPHKKDMDDIERLLKKGTRKGFLFYAVKIRSRYRSKRPNYDPELKTFDRIAEIGGGKSFWVNFGTLQQEHRNWGVARARTDASPERTILREILKAAMAKGYEDRVNAFVNVLEQYIEPTDREQRLVVPPHPPTDWRPPPRRPRDPQDR